MQKHRHRLTESTDTEAVPLLISEAQGQLIEAAESTGKAWDIILIEAGLSKNNRRYPASVLEAAAPMFEGAAVFADHPTDEERRTRPERSIRDKVGKLVGVKFGQHEVGGRIVEGLRATFKVIVPWMREMFLEAHEAGEPDFVGFSINAMGELKRTTEGARTVSEIQSIVKVDSVDVVTDPAAGGQVVRLVASREKGAPVAIDIKDLQAAAAKAARGVDKDVTDERIKELAEAATEALGDDADEASVAEAVKLAMVRSAKIAEASQAVVAKMLAESVGREAAKADEDADPDEATPGASLSEADRTLLTEARKDRNMARLERQLGETKLSDAGKGLVRGRIAEAVERRDVDDAEMGVAIAEVTTFESAMAQQGSNPTGLGQGGGDIQAVKDEMDVYLETLDNSMERKPDPTRARFRGFREAYSRFMGIQDVLGVHPQDIMAAMNSGYQSWNAKTLQESVGTGDWGEVFADVMHNKLIREYRQGPYQQWRAIVSDLESPNDFQTRHFTRIGGFGNLAEVAQKGTYQLLDDPTDEEVTYSVSKRGGLADVTFEAITNDSFQAVSRIPSGMARSASRTLNTAVMNLVTTDNGSMDYDSVALYHSDHGNTGTTALSVSGLNTTQVAMRDQTAYNESLEILGERNAIKILIVPNELEARAAAVVAPSLGIHQQEVADNATEVALDFFAGKGIQVIVYDVMTNTGDWFAIADPAEVPTVVVGFLGGQQEPELFVQDQATVGNNFTADKITYKIRHIWGLDVLDHRSFYRQDV